MAVGNDEGKGGGAAFITSKVDWVFNWGRSSALWPPVPASRPFPASLR